MELPNARDIFLLNTNTPNLPINRSRLRWQWYLAEGLGVTGFESFFLHAFKLNSTESTIASATILFIFNKLVLL